MSSRGWARLLLLLTVLVWGGSFAVVKSALADASPLLFNLLRMSLAAVLLAAVNWRALRRITRPQLLGGAVAGVFLAAGYQFQTLGLARTSAAKSGLITGLVVVLVPLLGLVPRLRIAGTNASPWLTGVGACLAFGGLVLLTTPPGSSVLRLFSGVGAGDLLTIVCAFGFALHLMTLAHVSAKMAPGVLASVQICAAALLMLVTLPLEHRMSLALTPRLLVALGVTSVFSTAAAFTVQSYAQKHLLATETAVLLTLEPVFATVTAAVLLDEHLTARGLGGAALILASIAMVELAPGLARAREIPG